MKKIYIVFFVIFCVSMFGVNKIQFSKKRFYSMGNGEQKQLDLYLPKSRNYIYRGVNKPPFNLEKLKNGKIKITYDISSLPIDKRINGKVYKANFHFTKRNIGKTYSISVSAKYVMELSFQKNEAQILNVNFSPSQTKTVIFLNSLFGGKYLIDYNKDLFSIDKNDILDLKKGTNKFELSLFTRGNFSDTLRVVKEFNNKKIDILKVAVKTSGFSGSTKKTISAVSTEVKPTIEKKLPAKIEKKQDENTINKIVNPKKFIKTTEVNTNANDFIYIIVIGVLLIIIIFLIIKIALSQKVANSEKYEMFYKNVSSLLEIDTTGKSIDNSLDEIMVKLLKLTDTLDKNIGTSSMDMTLDDSDGDIQSRYIDVNDLDIATKNETTFQDNYDFLKDEATDKNKKK